MRNERRDGLSRGQVLPVWVLSIVLTMVFGAFVASYGNVVAYQWRAQTAADSVARAAVAVQSQQFNQMLMTMYAAGVEEYRLRRIVEGLRVVAGGAGGCEVSGSCSDVYANLRQAWLKSLARYDADVRLMSAITSGMNPTAYQHDAQTLVSRISQGCGSGQGVAKVFACDPGSSSPSAGNAFTFALGTKGVQPRTAGLMIGRADATNIVLPSYYAATPAKDVNSMFTPIAVEVTACATVPPLFGWLDLGSLFHMGATKVAARGAATNVMVEQDWLEPGVTQNPLNGNKLFQPVENLGGQDASGLADASGVPLNWYSVNFGGTVKNVAPGSTAKTSSISAGITQDQYLARVGWWGPVSILPFDSSWTSPC